MDKESLEVHLQGHIDGIPLSNSSPTSFWPIQMRVLNGFDTEPWTVSVFEGPSKPPCIHEYLRLFLIEMADLMENGINVDNAHYSVELDSIIADAPARSFLKGIINHGAYGSCERCPNKGALSTKHTVIWPEAISERRTDKSFRDQEDRLHHLRRCLFEALSVDIISLFPLDPMHMVDLGVVKRFVVMLKSGAKGNRLNNQQMIALNSAMDHANQHFPSDFTRKRKNLELVAFWKAVEYKSFAMYSGPVVLKDECIFSKEKYEHFLSLHVALRLLSAPDIKDRPDDINFAEELLLFYAHKFGELYGMHHLVYNMHSLTHLAEDVRVHGPLPNFSAYAFENRLGVLKNVVNRSGRDKLGQLIARESEMDAADDVEFRLKQQEEKKSKIHLALRSIKPGSANDSYCLIQKDFIVKITEISPTHVRGSVFEGYEDFFKRPLESREIGIHVAKAVSSEVLEWELAEFKNAKKCMVVKKCNDYVIFPMNHY